MNTYLRRTIDESEGNMGFSFLRSLYQKESFANVEKK